MVEFAVQNGSVLDVPSDLLLMKHAQSFYGADQAVAAHLISHGVCKQADLMLMPGESIIIETNGSIAANWVMFLGTPNLAKFTYEEMQIFARRAIQKIASRKCTVRTMTTTVHGGGYGLDTGESLQRLVMGFKDGLANYNTQIEKIVFLTLGDRAQRMLASVLESMNLSDGIDKVNADRMRRNRTDIVDESVREASAKESVPEPITAQPKIIDPGQKNRVFVAMPYSDDFQNVYEYGIYPAVRNCGFICERVDEVFFTGDIVNRIKNGIESANLVIADLTGGRPNVYLEVGYAWGRGVPVIILVKKGEQLHFDVQGHRRIDYGRYPQLVKELEEMLRGILGERVARD